jgi:diacylglycerol kinase family enzyme
VIYNPAAGRGKAARRFAAVRREFAHRCEFRPTGRPGHAIALAKEAAVEGFERVVAAGGDGTVHEVANGLLAAGQPDVIFAPWPVGSMNDYAFATGHGGWWAAGRTGTTDTIRADVLCIRGAGGERYAVNGIGVGFNGQVTVESRKIRGVSGHLLYATAFLRAMVWHFATPALTVGFDDRRTVAPTLAVSVSVGQREGGFRLFNDARLDDGLADTLTVGAVKRWELARHLPGMLAGRLPVGHPHVRAGRCRSAIISSAVGLCVHADGELLCVPGDGVREVAIELQPARLRVEVCPAFRPAGR